MALMPRGPRLDYQGALHHVIARGIERRRIFRSAQDRVDFLARLGDLVLESRAALYAWALMPNHVHALLRTGDVSLSKLMQRLLGPYARAFNRRYDRCGHLFQNRFKNTLVEEEPYLLELVRYVHLNPVRSRLPVTLESLDNYPWTGHAVLLGNREFPAQDSDFVLGQFGQRVGEARQAYRRFVCEGARRTTTTDLEGGGLRRSAGGWELVPKLEHGREGWAFDERILGGPEFVEDVLGRFRQPDPQYISDAEPRTVFQGLLDRVARHCGLNSSEIASRTVRRDVLEARSLVCFLAVRRCGLSPAEVARYLRVSARSVGRAVIRAGSLRCSPEGVRKLLDN